MILKYWFWIGIKLGCLPGSLMSCQGGTGICNRNFVRRRKSFLEGCVEGCSLPCLWWCHCCFELLETDWLCQTRGGKNQWCNRLWITSSVHHPGFIQAPFYKSKRILPQLSCSPQTYFLDSVITTTEVCSFTKHSRLGTAENVDNTLPGTHWPYLGITIKELLLTIRSIATIARSGTESEV